MSSERGTGAERWLCVWVGCGGGEGLTVSQQAGSIMAAGVLSRLRSWALRHCSAGRFLRGYTILRESNAAVTDWGQDKRSTNRESPFFLLKNKFREYDTERWQNATSSRQHTLCCVQNVLLCYQPALHMMLLVVSRQQLMWCCIFNFPTVCQQMFQNNLYSSYSVWKLKTESYVP